MSTTYLYAAIYVENEKGRASLIEAFESAAGSIPLGNDDLSLERVDTDEVMTIEGLTGLNATLAEDFLEWIDAYDPHLVTVRTWGDWEFDSKSLAMKKGRAAAYATVQKAMTKLSKRIESGLLFSTASEAKLLKYLGESAVDPLERFQGVRHIERAIARSHLRVVDWFVERGLDPNLEIAVAPSTNAATSPMTFEFVRQREHFGLLRKLIERGARIDVANDYGGTLLHATPHEYFEQVKLLVESGVDIHRLDVSGRTPLMEMVRIHCLYSDDDDIEATQSILRVATLLADNGARLDLYDQHGAGVLLYARRHPSIREWLLIRATDLQLHDPAREFDDVVVTLFRGRRHSIEFFEQCIKEQVTSFFAKPAFAQALLSNPAIQPPQRPAKQVLCETGAGLLSLASRHDCLALAKALTRLGFPMLMPGGSIQDADGRSNWMSSFDRARHEDAAKILMHMHETGLTQDYVEKMSEQLDAWRWALSAQGISMKVVREHASAAWIEERERAIAAELRDQVLDRGKVDSLLCREFSNVLRLSAEKSLMADVWGNAVLGRDIGVIVRRGTEHEVVTRQEFYDSINLRLGDAPRLQGVAD